MWETAPGLSSRQLQKHVACASTIQACITSCIAKYDIFYFLVSKLPGRVRLPYLYISPGYEGCVSKLLVYNRKPQMTIFAQIYRLFRLNVPMCT